ncbi:hypothetical protein BJV77DRAFT_360579 [Russula vinacea]|nr:hypothetical protein BJV77DRAFT_360579 [Russula vinacea]
MSRLSILNANGHDSGTCNSHACSATIQLYIVLVPPTSEGLQMDKPASERTLADSSLCFPNVFARQSSPFHHLPHNHRERSARNCRSRRTPTVIAAAVSVGEDESKSQIRTAIILQPSPPPASLAKAVPACEAPGGLTFCMFARPSIGFWWRWRSCRKKIKKPLLPRLRFFPFCSAVTPNLHFSSGSSVFTPVFEPLQQPLQPSPPPLLPTGLIGGARAVVQGSACSVHSGPCSGQSIFQLV